MWWIVIRTLKSHPTPQNEDSVPPTSNGLTKMVNGLMSIEDQKRLRKEMAQRQLAAITNSQTHPSLTNGIPGGQLFLIFGNDLVMVDAYFSWCSIKIQLERVFFKSIAKGTTESSHWALWPIRQHLQFKAEASTSFEILVNLGFVLQMARNK